MNKVQEVETLSGLPAYMTIMQHMMGGVPMNNVVEFLKDNGCIGQDQSNKGEGSESAQSSQK